jgi:hypothetical protein
MRARSVAEKLGADESLRLGGGAVTAAAGGRADIVAAAIEALLVKAGPAMLVMERRGVAEATGAFFGGRGATPFDEFSCSSRISMTARLPLRTASSYGDDPQRSFRSGFAPALNKSLTPYKRQRRRRCYLERQVRRHNTLHTSTWPSEQATCKAVRRS